MITWGIALWIVALVFMLVALKNIIVRAFKKRRCTATVAGVITDVREKVRRKNGFVKSREFIPIVSYTVEGVEYRKRFIKAYTSGTYAIGQTVDVAYNPNKPSRINKMGTSSKTDVIFLCIGVAIGVAGAVLMVVELAAR